VAPGKSWFIIASGIAAACSHIDFLSPKKLEVKGSFIRSYNHSVCQKPFKLKGEAQKKTKSSSINKIGGGGPEENKGPCPYSDYTRKNKVMSKRGFSFVTFSSRKEKKSWAGGKIEEISLLLFLLQPAS
jgi:hypothetical protein